MRKIFIPEGLTARPFCFATHFLTFIYNTVKCIEQRNIKWIYFMDLFFLSSLLIISLCQSACFIASQHIFILFCFKQQRQTTKEKTTSKLCCGIKATHNVCYLQFNQVFCYSHFDVPPVYSFASSSFLFMRACSLYAVLRNTHICTIFPKDWIEQ